MLTTANPTIQIYTDGACSGNPGKGGWASVLLCGSHKKEIYGYNESTTNNRMELTAVVEALKCIKPIDGGTEAKRCIDIYSDSAYVVNAFNHRWIEGWQANGWKNSNKQEVQNKELWLQLLSLIERHNVTFHKVKGHSTNFYNNRCDELARAAIKNKGATINA